MDERRNEKRNVVSVFLRVFEKTSNEVIGHIVDINGNGFRLLTGSPLKIEQEYSFYMDLSMVMNFEQRVVFSATCKWWRKDEDSGKYYCGFGLSNIPQNDIQIIEKIMKQFEN